MKQPYTKPTGAEYLPPEIEILYVTPECGFAATGNGAPEFDDPDILSWEYGDYNNVGE
ncbi:hypothetical protein [uncultured Alistipes sp.]|uniref:hypothetical protein n=1 Tax=uncultured Alistipes sp. TaxID=538949 RepID=UPI00262719AD|nr:hypothetical protein [uncultured Alistipes sp.]